MKIAAWASAGIVRANSGGIAVLIPHGSKQTHFNMLAWRDIDPMADIRPIRIASFKSDEQKGTHLPARPLKI